MLTSGQRDALSDLDLIEAQQQGLRIESTCLAGSWLVVRLSLDCRELRAEQTHDGLSLRDREFVSVHVPPHFPIEPPRLSVRHKRFLGYDNAMRGGGLCVFRSPDTEWDPKDGMAVFVNDRVWGWLRKASRGEVEQQGGVFHAPVTTHLPFSGGFISYQESEPNVSGVWQGYVRMRRDGDVPHGAPLPRFTLTHWSTEPLVERRRYLSAAAVLLPERLDFYFPETLGDLIRSLERAGVDPRDVVAHLARVIRLGSRDTPALLVLGVPLRRSDLPSSNTGDETARKHALTTVLFSDQASKLLWNAGGTRQREQAISAVLEQADALKAFVLFGRDARPGVVTRRDRRTPMSWFHGRSAAVWGTGALGGPIAMYLARAGVRRLILRDYGRVHTGLLVRQPFAANDAEALKAKALAHRLRQIRPDLDVVVVTDDLRGDQLAVEEWNGGVDVVINATASTPVRVALDHARAATLRENSPTVPILTVGVDGNAERGFARLLPAESDQSIEELDREFQIQAASTPELASYAAAFFPRPDVETMPFYPEPGCSDATFAGSAADLAVLAGSMLNWAAKTLQSDSDGHPPLLGRGLFCAPPHVSLDDDGRGAHLLTTTQRRSLPDSRGEYEVRVSPAALTHIEEHIRDAASRLGPDAETGGLLWGGYDDAQKIIWVDGASRAPKDSSETPSRFVCGVEGVCEKADEWEAKSGGVVRFAGTWHTHPQGGVEPSARDRASAADVCTRNEPLPRRFLMLIVGIERTGSSPGNLASSPLTYGAHVFHRDEFASAPSSS
ncbi:MAG: ThiF family adenylyltransferase [Bacteroidota bacterium]